MKKALVLLAFVLFCTASYSQYSRHIIRFKDKKGTTFTLSNPTPYLSAKSQQRRASQKINLDSTDLPVSAAYMDSIRKVPNVEIIHSSKWLNQVLIRTTDAAALAKINSFPFVQTSVTIAPRAIPGGSELINRKFDYTYTQVPQRSPLYGRNRTNEIHDEISYGNTLNQVHVHEGEFLHNLGLRGQGVTIAVLDAGFSTVPTNPAFDSIRLQGKLLGGYDFVTNTAVVSQAHGHGMNCLSVIAANRPGVMVGTAPSANFWLLRTEDAASEFPVEEHNWAVAAEFADSAGVDMISSSLGYTSFDNPAYNHSYADRNGDLCMSTIAADLAARKGIIVMNSAGNSGGLTSEEKYVSCPADGDSVVAVGAIKSDLSIAGFSSWGPNGAGKVKPDFVSIGQGTIVANGVGNPVASNGTSFSNPNLAGLVACLWQGFPEFTNMEIIEAVRRSSDRANNPDIRFGYGIPNFRLAYDLLAEERARKNSELILGQSFIKAYPNPFTTQLNIIIKAPNNGNAQVRLMDLSGRILETRSLNVVQGQLYYQTFSSLDRFASAMYFVQYIDGKVNETLKITRKY